MVSHAGTSAAAKPQDRRRRAFTLIELLVVITIISILISILLPGLASAKKLGKMVREQASAKQFATAWSGYTYDQKDFVLIPYMSWAWAHQPTPPSLINMQPSDPADPTRFIEGDVIKVWPLRFLGATSYTVQGIQNDGDMFSNIDARSKTFTQQNAATRANLYDDATKYQYAVAWHPSFGLNGVYVGGFYHLGGFPNSTQDAVGDPRSGVAQGGQFYVKRISDVTNTSLLLVGSTSHGVDIAQTGRGADGFGASDPAFTAGTSRVLPGYHKITPPRTGFPPGSGTTAWVARDQFDPNADPKNWGYVDYRHFDRAVSMMTDGHVENFTIAQMRDMRRWSNYATSANWTFQHR